MEEGRKRSSQAFRRNSPSLSQMTEIRLVYFSEMAGHVVSLSHKWAANSKSKGKQNLLLVEASRFCRFHISNTTQFGQTRKYTHEPRANAGEYAKTEATPGKEVFAPVSNRPRQGSWSCEALPSDLKVGLCAYFLVGSGALAGMGAMEVASSK